MNYADALAIANRVVALLAPTCERIEIAGSLRREKPDVHDIDVVAVPRMQTATDLFGAPTAVHKSMLDPLLVGLGTIKKNGPRQKQILLPEGIHLELWLVLPPAQWGAILTIRTGPGDFAKWLVTPRSQGGAMPSYLREREGGLYNGAQLVETPEERDYFAALGLRWIETRERARPPAIDRMLLVQGEDR